MGRECEILKTKELSFGKIELRSDNILVFRPCVKVFKEYNIEILKELHREFVAITDGIPRPYMVNNQYITGLVNKEEMAFIDQNFPDFATKSAIITHSVIMKVLVNSYNTLFKPKVEVCLFTSEDPAVAWLLDN
jgi:hypothetical protein